MACLLLEIERDSCQDIKIDLSSAMIGVDCCQSFGFCHTEFGLLLRDSKLPSFIVINPNGCIRAHVDTKTGFTL